ncbi:CshA/CshB family fibrillar adhesin-related protein [Microbacterium suaedae]|uniref:CshA/CshB family fibrillar adhesin-related protein n=1 Tax=Microbacterium suaedae TaxID=2067813 RepID=UPI0013A6499A|nr:CshA/CshB family fibrillar adhesin-related protein [Microbacterium suaedae]
MTSVLAIVAGVLVAASSLLTAAPAQAAYASGGEGLYHGSIDWIEWGGHGDGITNGTTATSTREIAGQELTTTCVATNVAGDVQAYRSGAWDGDGLDNLYHVGSGGPGNELVQAVANRNAGQRVSFDFSCDVTLDGVSVPIQGLVIADAESSNHNDNPDRTEFVSARPHQDATWRIIDRYRTPSCERLTTAEIVDDGTMTFRPDTRECYYDMVGGQGPMAVGFMEGATSASVVVKGGGRSAIALGVVLDVDFGDAPESYGEAAAIFEPTWQDGLVTTGRTEVSTENFVLATPSAPQTRLGDLIDSEPAALFSVDAKGDDEDGSADEDAVGPIGQIAVTPGLTYTLPEVACTGPGFVAGWIDWNGNGVFDDGERSDAVECAGGSVDLDWTIPADTVEGASFLRLRIAEGEADVASPVGITTSGEVEDHALSVRLPVLDIAKTSDATENARPGDTISYTVTATNNSGADYTSDYPAVVFDDLSGVLDDAEYNGDASATASGAVAYAEPLLSWTGALPDGDSVELSYTVTLGSAGDGAVRNVAWEPEDPENPEPPTCDPAQGGVDSVTGEPCANHEYLLPRLSITKTADRTELPAVGERAQYTITVTNEGPGAYTADAPATFTDDLMDVLDAADYEDDATATVGEVTYHEPILSWEGALGANESAEITYSVTYTAEGNRHLRNLACIPESETAPGAASCDGVDIPGAGLTTWKEVVSSDEPAVAGSELTYTLFFANDGEAAATVDHIDDLTHVTDDADVTVEPSSEDGLTATRDGNRIAVTGSVPVGETYEVSYQVTVRPDGERGDDIAANFLLRNDPENPPSTPEEPVCEPVDDQFPDCTSTPIAELAYVKWVTASSDPVVAGTVLTYEVVVISTGEATATVSREDVLTGVLDDAELSSAPVSDTDSVTVSDVVDGRFQIGGELPSGEIASITYEVTVKPDSERGDNSADNFLVSPGETPPEVCVPYTASPTSARDADPRRDAAASSGTPECTTTPIPLIEAAKSSDPESGTAVTPGQEVTYTLTFANTGKAAGAVDHVDDLADVLDDATLTAAPVASDDALTVAQDGDVLRVTGTLVPDQVVTVTYTVTVKPDAERENNRLGNVLARSGDTDPECGDDGVSCTQHPIPELVSWKSVDADSVPVMAGTVLTYTLYFDSVGEAPAQVRHVDLLDHVTDDADVTAEPVSEDGLTVDRDGNRITVSGEVPVGETYEVTYQVTARADGERGDDLAANFLLPNDPEDPPAPPEEPVCQPGDVEQPDCTITPIGRLLVGKTVSADTDPVDVGTVLTYTLTFDNQGKGPSAVDHTDVLTDVLDDADLTAAPTASDDALTASEVTDGAFRITGELAAGQTVTVAYQVTIKEITDRGNNLADNFLIPTGETPPTECTDDDGSCTSTALPLVDVVKSSDPEPGTGLQAGQEVAYTLTFTNTGEAAGAVDFTDDLAAVLDDAELTGAPVSSDPALLATDGANGEVRVTGTLEPEQLVTVTYTVTVRPDGERGDNQLRNLVARTGEEPPASCEPGRCTEHPIGELDDWKSVDPATGSTLRPGETATYTLHFTNSGNAPVTVNRDDVLTQVLDDADVTAQPAASSDALSVTEITDGRFTITGELAAGEQATVAYEVTVNPDGQRGDDRLGNFLVPNGENPPEACVPADPERADCTVNHVSDVAVEKSSDPESGSTVEPGDEITYTVTFTNRSANPDADPVAVDYTDHMADVLDDATLTAGPTVSDEDLAAELDDGKMRMTGTVPTGAVYTVTYTVTVNAFDEQGDRTISNVVAITGEEPACVEGSPLCTTHRVPEPPADLPSTGVEITGVVMLAALLLLGAGGGMVLFVRRRKAAVRTAGQETSDDDLI